MALLTPAEAAERLAISTKHLVSLTRAGAIRYVNVGLGEKNERRRYDPKDIEDFIHRRSQIAYPLQSIGGRARVQPAYEPGSNFLADVRERRRQRSEAKEK